MILFLYFKMEDGVTDFTMDDGETDDSIPLEETLLLCTRRGQTAIISDILKSRNDGKLEIDINCKGRNTASQIVTT